MGWLEKWKKEQQDRETVVLQITMMILDAREKAGLTQSELANLCKMKQSAIARIEAGKALPTVGTLFKISQALGKKIIISFD